MHQDVLSTAHDVEFLWVLSKMLPSADDCVASANAFHRWYDQICVVTRSTQGLCVEQQKQMSLCSTQGIFFFLGTRLFLGNNRVLRKKKKPENVIAAVSDYSCM